MSPHWFPDRKLIKSSAALVDVAYADLDQHAARYKEHNLIYRQISRGTFRSRIVSAHLKHLDIYTSFTSQATESQIEPPTDRFTFSVVLDAEDQFKFQGEDLGGHAVYVHPPRGEINEVGSAGGTILVLSVDAAALLGGPALRPEVVEWLLGIGPYGAIIESEKMATAIRQLQQDCLEVMLSPLSQEKLEFLSKFMLHHICTSLSMALLLDGLIHEPRKAADFLRYREARTTLIGLIEQERHGELETQVGKELQHLGSMRLIQKALAENVGMGPLQYWRLLRLHNVRRKLLEPERLQRTIADIAAEEGFWEPSRFGLHYSRQFGERPSDTRKRLDPGGASRRSA